MELTQLHYAPDHVDRILNLPTGRIARLVRKGLINASILPDGTIRISKETLAALLKPRPYPIAQAGEIPNQPI